MIIYFLAYWSSSTIDIYKVLVGSWNISSATLSSDGNEIPNNISYFYLNLFLNSDENYIYGNLCIQSTSEIENENIYIQFDRLNDEDPIFSIKFFKYNNTNEFSELTLLKINVGLDDMMTATGNAMGIKYSLDINPPTSAELTTFDQDTKQLRIYRFSKKISRRKFCFENLLPFITTFIYTAIKFLIN